MLRGEREAHEKLSGRLINEANRQAWRVGLHGTEAEEYMSFFLFKCAQLEMNSPFAYLARSGHNAALNHLRAERLRRKHEYCCPIDGGADTPIFLLRVTAPDKGPVAMLLRAELSRAIEAAFERLSASQQALWRLAVMEGRTAAEIARLTGRTPLAIRQALWATRKRLSSELERQGFDEETIRQYLSEIQAVR